MADEICEEIALGGALYRMCQERAHWPAERTVYQWLEAHQDFAQKYARARERAADRRVAEIVEIADSAKDAQLARVQIDARKWQAAKFAPKKYGDRVQLAGDAEQPLLVQQELTPLEAARRVAFAIALAQHGDPSLPIDRRIVDAEHKNDVS
jgi:hypothetical protein